MRRGFTLMELMLIMVLVGAVALLLISYTGDVGNVSVDAASWKIESDIRFAQQLATTQEALHGVLFIAGGNYTVYRGTEATPVTDPHDRQPMVEDLQQFGGVALGESYRVEFDKVGAPVLGGGGDVSVIADSGAIRRIYVIENTGAVVVDVLDYGSGCSCEMCAEGG